MNRIKPKHLIVAACVIIALLLCCGAASFVGVGPSVGSVDFDSDGHGHKKKKSTKKPKATKKRSLAIYDAVLAGHFHTRHPRPRNCITCHG